MLIIVAARIETRKCEDSVTGKLAHTNKNLPGPTCHREIFNSSSHFLGSLTTRPLCLSVYQNDTGAVPYRVAF
jgi:hypothetical protein